MQRRTGGDLPTALQSLARVIRDRLNYYRQFRAATAAARLSSILIGLTGPAIAVGMWMLQPEYLRHFLEQPGGPQTVLRLIIVATCLYVLGIVWIVKLLRPAD